jgi:hypothetical protein
MATLCASLAACSSSTDAPGDSPDRDEEIASDLAPVTTKASGNRTPIENRLQVESYKWSQTVDTKRRIVVTTWSVEGGNRAPRGDFRDVMSLDEMLKLEFAYEQAKRLQTNDATRALIATASKALAIRNPSGITGDDAAKLRQSFYDRVKPSGGRATALSGRDAVREAATAVPPSAPNGGGTGNILLKQTCKVEYEEFNVSQRNLASNALVAGGSCAALALMTAGTAGATAIAAGVICVGALGVFEATIPSYQKARKAFACCVGAKVPGMKCTCQERFPKTYGVYATGAFDELVCRKPVDDPDNPFDQCEQSDNCSRCLADAAPYFECCNNVCTPCP